MFTSDFKAILRTTLSCVKLIFIDSSGSNCSVFHLYIGQRNPSLCICISIEGVWLVYGIVRALHYAGDERDMFKIFLFQDHRIMVKTILIRCFIHFAILSLFAEAEQLYCNSTWDTVSCWPTTLAGRLAVLPCPSEVDGVRYNTSRTFVYSP